VSAVPKVEVDEAMAKSIAYLDKCIAEGDELGLFQMVKSSLLDGDSKWEEWAKNLNLED
jgi:hypothetical protein